MTEKAEGKDDENENIDFYDFEDEISLISDSS